MAAIPAIRWLDSGEGLAALRVVSAPEAADPAERKVVRVEVEDLAAPREVPVDQGVVDQERPEVPPGRIRMTIGR